MQYRCDSGSLRRLQVRAWLLCGCLGLWQAAVASAVESPEPVAAQADAVEDAPVASAPAARAEVEPLPSPTDGALAARYWVPRAQLSAEQAEALPEFCGGRYVLPEFPYPLDSNPDEFPIRGDAENVTYFLDGRMSLNGAVSLEQGNRTITAQQGSLDKVSGQGFMTGQVEVLEPGLVFEGQAARIDLESRAAGIDGVEFLLPAQALRGAAASITQDAEGNLVVSDGRFTRCEPGNRNWHIAVSELEINRDDIFATARHAVVRIGDLPVLYTPYLRFPVQDQRQSGLLFPDIGFSERDGLDLRVPYYLNLAPDYDATVAPRRISDRGTGVEGEFRHLARWGRTKVLGAYLFKDEIFDGKLSRDDFNSLRQQGLVSGDFNPAERWLYGIDHAGGFGDFTTTIDYRAVSDRDYFRDLGGDLGVASRLDLERRGEIGYNQGGLQMRLWAQRFDRLDDGTVDPYQRLPQFDARYTGALFGPFEWSMAAQLASFDRTNENLTGIDRAVGSRIHLEPRIRLPFYWPWGYLRFGGGLRHTEYDLRELDPGYERSPERTIGLASVDGGLYFDRTMEAFGRPLTHSLEPQVFYLYQGYENQNDIPRFDASELTFSYYQLFRENRFSGLDRVGDANQLSLGLTTRFIDRVNGREYLRASAGQIVYFSNRRVGLTGEQNTADQERTSAFAGEISGSITQRWRVTSTLIYDPHLNEVDEGAIALQYRLDDRRMLNFGYRDRLRDDISQADVSAYWPISKRFGFIGRWNYDYEQNRVIETFGGLEYNDCCWQIRVIGRRFLNIPTGPNLVTGADQEVVRPEDGVFLQIVFKGMGGVGNSLESMLARGIRGYRTENYDDF